MMKAFKILLTALVFGLLLSCSAANAVIRVGLEDFVIFEFTDSGPAVTEEYNKSRKKYSQILMDMLSKTGEFEVVDLGDKYLDYIRKVYEKRRHNYQMSLEDSIRLRKEFGRSENCSYLIRGQAMFSPYVDHPPVPKNIPVLVHLFVESTMPDTKTVTFEGSVTKNTTLSSSSSLSPSSSKATKTKSKAKSNSKSSKKSKKNDGFDTTENEKIIVEALSQAAERMCDEFTGNGAKITAINGNNITINKGLSSKSKVGDRYSVEIEMSDGLDEFFGESSAEKVTLAYVEVKDVQEDFSVAEIIPDAGNISNIRVGDKLSVLSYFIDLSSAVQSSKFPDKRPENNKVALNTSAPKQTATTLDPLPELPAGTMRVGVMRFDSKVLNVLDRDAAAVTDLFSRLLSNSDKIAVLERDRLEVIAREQKLNLSGIIDPSTAAQVGKLAGCQYILMGSITNAEENESTSGNYITPKSVNNYSYNYNTKAGMILGGIGILVDIIDAMEKKEDNVVTEIYEMTAGIDARLVNVETSEIIAVFHEKGSAEQTQTVTQDKDGYTKSIEDNYGGLQNQAIASAAANLSHKIREALTGEYPQISSVNGDEIIINRGSSSGVQNGDLFCVYPDGKSPADTEAIISVKDIQDSFSIAELASAMTASYSPTAGNRVEPVLHGDFRKGIWHIKNQKRADAKNKDSQNDSISLEDISKNSSSRKRFENASTEIKKVIKSYGLSPKDEKALIDAHTKASKISSTKKKYEAYVNLSNADFNDYLAAYNAGRYAFESQDYVQAGEFAEKALYTNPNYKPAKDLIAKLNGENSDTDKSKSEEKPKKRVKRSK